MATILGDTRGETTALGRFVLGVYRDWQENRAGLEAKWQDNRDAFRGIDRTAWRDADDDDREDGGDTTAGETATTFRGKKDWRSRATIRLTKQKVLTAYALVVDSILQGGKVPFALALHGETEVNAEDLPPGQADAIDNSIADMAARINGQLEETDADRNISKCVLSAAVYGRCWAKFRPARKVKRVMQRALAIDPATGQPMPTESWEVARQEAVLPSVQFVSVWDMFYDVEADDVRYGAGVIHRQYVSPRDLRAMPTQGGDGWDADAINRALAQCDKQAPSGDDGTEEMIPRLRDVRQRKNTVRILEAWVMVPRDTASAYARDQGRSEDALTQAELEDPDRRGDDVPCLVVLAGDEVVRFVPLDEGDPWPFFSVPWEEDIDEPDACGVADNISASQAVLNSAIRCFEDNKRFSASLILGLKRRMILNPAWDGKVKPNMVLDIAEDARSISDAVSAFPVPDVGNSLITLIEMFRTFGDEESMVPKIMSGARDADQTAREAVLRAEKGGKYMGSVVRNFDEYLIAPAIQMIYEWNMMDPAVQTGKGPYDVRPMGFKSFQDRVIRLQALQQALAMVLSDPELRQMHNIREMLAELYKAMELDPDEWLKSVQVLQKEAAQPDPAAQMQAESAAAEIDKTKADTEKARTDAMVAVERLKIERAKAVKDLTTPPQQPKGTAQKPPPPNAG